MVNPHCHVIGLESKKTNIMMASSAKDRFDAAVKVIRGLPANGPFQPSYELMLKFYSYYKQATEGKCTSPKPSFWDVVNKKKWEAWNKLGDMEKEKAMTLYVDELKKVSNHVKETYYPPQIVETMPQTDEVSVFLQKLDTFYEMVEESGEGTKAGKEGSNSNGDIKAIANGDPVKAIMGGHDSSLDQDALNHSDNITLLLKQDMKKAQESSGILVSSENGSTNGHASHNGNHLRGGPHINGRGGQEEDDDDDDDGNDSEDESDDEQEEEEEEDEEPVAGEEEFVRVQVNQEVSSAPNNEPRPFRNGVSEWSESETENEEFCDTSDEPVNVDLLDSPARHPNGQTPSRPNIPHNPVNSSTPMTHQSQAQLLHNSKSIRVNGAIPSSSSSSLPPPPLPTSSLRNTLHPHHRHSNRILSDSMEVQTSRIAERELETEAVINPTFASTSYTSPSSSFLSVNPDSFSTVSSGHLVDGGKVERGLMGAEVNCRGGEGEEEARDRRRKGGSHSSRGGGGSSRDAARRGGNGGAGSGGSEGGARPPHQNRGGAGGSRDPPLGSEEGSGDLNEQIVVTLLRLQRDMSGVLNRLHSLEALVKEGRREQEERKRMAKKGAWWWPFPDLSLKSAALVFLWPIILQVVLTYISRRRSRRLRK